MQNSVVYVQCWSKLFHHLVLPSWAIPFSWFQESEAFTGSNEWWGSLDFRSVESEKMWSSHDGEKLFWCYLFSSSHADCIMNHWCSQSTCRKLSWPKSLQESALQTDTLVEEMRWSHRRIFTKLWFPSSSKLGKKWLNKYCAAIYLFT